MSIAIVTGVSSGIGRSTAAHLASRGSGVILTYKTNPPKERNRKSWIERSGGVAIASSGWFGRFRDRVARVLAHVAKAAVSHS